MSATNLDLMAHLMRRAGFGARRDELDALVSRRYEDVVEDLVNPERFPEVDHKLLSRYYGTGWRGFQPRWNFRMLNSQRQLEEKMALFWHHVFATSGQKSGNWGAMMAQIEMFRVDGLGKFDNLLKELSSDPSMIFWLDNNENREVEPNENYGREILELFSMGVGNYTEGDVKAASKAFSGWSIATPLPTSGRMGVYGGYPAQFVYRPEDHDDRVKDLLGETGRFNGEDAIEVIVGQPATANFITRHLYNFFVADEPPVAAWGEVAPQDPDAIATLVDAYFDSEGDLGSMMRVLLNSDFFKNARAMRVKSPTELVMGVIKLVDTYTYPDPGLNKLTGAAGQMGQQLLRPLSVEGWHYGKEWIDGGTLNQRVNFAVSEIGDGTKPGVKTIVERLRSVAPLQPEAFVDECLELAGPMAADDRTRSGLLAYAESGGELAFGNGTNGKNGAERVVDMLKLIVSTREYQMA